MRSSWKWCWFIGVVIACCASAWAQVTCITKDGGKIPCGSKNATTWQITAQNLTHYSSAFPCPDGHWVIENPTSLDGGAEWICPHEYDKPASSAEKLAAAKTKICGSGSPQPPNCEPPHDMESFSEWCHRAQAQGQLIACGDNNGTTSGLLLIPNGAPAREYAKHTMTVEKLAESEVLALAEAKKKVEDAQAAYEMAVSRVKEAHHQVLCPSGMMDSSYQCTSETGVTLWGDWALIDAATWNPVPMGGW